MTTTTQPSVPQRLASIDAYRGFVMFLMMAEVLRLCAVSRAIPDSGFWKFLCWHQSHVEWVGCSLHDLIQPSFSFLVGVALPFSIASRRARGQSLLGMTAHAFFRAILLILLGIFLRSIGKPQTYFTFEDTLTQIGLGYGFLFLVGLGPKRLQWGALGLVLIGYWLAFALYPTPAADFDWSKTGVTADWEHNLKGLAAHWNKNTNLAWAFDNWFLNLFPRKEPFLFNGGGYSTLSFIPTLGTMILGLIAGTVLRNERAPWDKVKWLVTAGVVSIVVAAALDRFGLCPIVKRIWTPAWTIYSGGWCLLLLALSYALVDLVGLKGLAFPLIVIGMNSITAYCSDALFLTFIQGTLKTHLGSDFFKLFGAAYETFFRGWAVLFVLWLLLFWMYRRKIFLRI